jgi:phosphatidylserine/phosphatidylglycerophosphate/cardiolipin synthase-like enzyme
MVALRGHIGRDADDAAAALQHAGVTAHGHLLPDGARALAQAEALALLLADRRATTTTLVLTVPDFLRSAWQEHLRNTPPTDWPRETSPALIDIAAQAAHTLLLTAPYLNTEQCMTLAPHVTRLTRNGGSVLVITRAADIPGPCGNAEAVNLLQQAAAHADAFAVWSWPGPTIGLHLKALIADKAHGYLGSANLTSHGALFHAEAGVLLHGPLARQLDTWLRRIARQPPPTAVDRVSSK